MRIFDSARLGVDQGSELLFSDFDRNGRMWRGSGHRSVRKAIAFSTAFSRPPVVNVGISMWDLDQKTNQRADISAENITCDGFDLVFRTWADTRVARIRADWMALGPLPDPDLWDLD